MKRFQLQKDVSLYNSTVFTQTQNIFDNTVSGMRCLCGVSCDTERIRVENEILKKEEKNNRKQTNKQIHCEEKKDSFSADKNDAN